MNFGKIALSGKLSRASMVRMLWIAVLLQCLVAAFSVEVLAAPSGVNNDNITPLDQAEQARAMKLLRNYVAKFQDESPSAFESPLDYGYVLMPQDINEFPINVAVWGPDLSDLDSHRINPPRRR